MGGIALVDHFFKIARVFAHRALDGGLHPVFGHVDALGIRHGLPEPRIVGRIRSARLDRYGNVFPDTGKLLRHLVVARKHLVLSLLEYASHGYCLVEGRKRTEAGLKFQCNLCADPSAG